MDDLVARRRHKKKNLLAYLQHVVKAFKELEQFEVFDEDVVVDGGGRRRRRAHQRLDEGHAGCAG